MVGVVIAMIGVVIIFQMLATSESRKRSASSGSDTQVSGVVGITALERDVREAGYGFSSAAFDNAATPVMGCTVNAYDTARPTAAYTFRLTPIQIAQGASGASDTIIVLRGNGSTFPAAHVFTESTDTTKKTRGRAGLSPRDYALIARTSPTLDCLLVEITEVNNDFGTCTTCADAVTVQHKQGSYSYVTYLPNNATQIDSRTARYNNATPPVSFTNGFIFNLGNGARRNLWTVNNNRLQVTNDLLYLDIDGTAGNDPVEITEGVINLQAEYGIDANNNGQIETGEWTTTDPATTGGWANVLAVRLAMLMRSGQYERTQVTTAIPTWSGGATSPLLVTNLDNSPSSAAPASGKEVDDWRHYRYRVYETVIPLRNILWGANIRP
jgi:type IV pilus assembly protein PilW